LSFLPPAFGRVADVPLRSFVAQLKVNLRPLWSPAIRALASLSDRFGDVVWRLICDELQSLDLEQESNITPLWVKEVNEGCEGADAIREEEKSWRDPAAHKLRTMVAKWLDDGFAQAEFAKVQFAFSYSILACD
jgi:U3 small nucleolar RNA-associated protein 20